MFCDREVMCKSSLFTPEQDKRAESEKQQAYETNDMSVPSPFCVYPKTVEHWDVSH